MKRIFLLLAVVLSVFCFGSAALAEGFTVSGDLTLGSPNNGDDEDLGYLTAGGDYDIDSFVFGGSLLVCVYKDPPLESYEEAMTYFYGVYGGYRLLDGDSFSLAALAGYYAYKQDYENKVGIPANAFGPGVPPVNIPPFSLAWNASSLMVGVNAAFNADPFTVSLIYMYGVTNTSTIESDVFGSAEITDPSVSWFELKGSYAFNDAWSIYVAYRGFSLDGYALTIADPYAETELGAKSFGVGMTYKF